MKNVNYHEFQTTQKEALHTLGKVSLKDEPALYLKAQWLPVRMPLINLTQYRQN